jgi:hypothetical protein
MEKLLEKYKGLLNTVEIKLLSCNPRSYEEVRLENLGSCYRSFIYDIKEEIESKKAIQEMITKIESEKALTPCIKFKWGDCVCKSECKRGFSKE